MRRDVGLMTTVERTQYDDLGRVVSSTDILGRITRTEYSEDGLTTTVTTPAGAHAGDAIPIMTALPSYKAELASARWRQGWN